uniref:Bifunctional inhibitor/plant lipid transfer protein/seed storage helical domain-containing protein n=1 Tax=Arundo donax TaxID=35708 RepID=A0A0A9GNA0_ARUDO
MAFTARAASSAAAVACLLLALAPSTAGAGSPAPAPAVDCIAAASSLSDCLDYVSPGSVTSRPNKKCCGEVKAAVAQPALVDCLCSFFGSKNIPIPIDTARVLALPGACGASNAAFSKCHITAAPTEGNSVLFTPSLHCIVYHGSVSAFASSSFAFMTSI